MENQQQLAAVREQALAGDVETRWNEQANVFRTEALNNLPQVIPGLTQEEVQYSLEMYGARLTARQRELEGQGYQIAQIVEVLAPSSKEFFEYAGHYLTTRPGVVAALRSRQAAEDAERRRIEAQANERTQAELRQAAGRHALNPQRNLGGVASIPGSLEGTVAESNVGKSIAEIRAASKSRLRAMGERYANRGG
jgi:hypothetical protein